ncbi:glycosyltransferase [Desulfarculus baarsii]
MDNASEAAGPNLSVVIPVFNEEENLAALQERLGRVLDGAGYDWEIIYVDDGSRDRSWEILCSFNQQDHRVRLVRFNRNYGQHMAVFAGMERSKGQVVVTLDADLQNPPEDIPKLVDKIDEGYDVVGGWREHRQDSWLRTLPSAIVNRLTSRVTGVDLKDYGCMLRAYRRQVVEAMNACEEASSFIPALANSFANSVAEIPVGHAQRGGGQSKYGLYRLLKLHFDLMTGFSVLPIQFVSFMGLIIALVGVGFGAFLFVRRLVVGPELEGVFTLFAILFTFVGLQIFCVGLIGEYVGRIYREVRKRPRYLVREMRG